MLYNIIIIFRVYPQSSPPFNSPEITKLQSCIPALQAFDPNVEAFKILDPDNTGHVDIDVLKRMLLQMPGIDAVRGLQILHAT